MDAVQAFSRQRNGFPDIDDFIVMGGSKRGWTTWLTAAADPLKRVKAIVPISIDMLNLDRQFTHHWGSYGFYAPATYDYLEFDLGCRLQPQTGDGEFASDDDTNHPGRDPTQGSQHDKH